MNQMKLRANRLRITGVIASFFATNLVHVATWAASERELRKTGNVSSIQTNVDESPSSLKTVNFRVGPLHALLGIADVEVDFGVSDSFTLGPTFSYMNRSLEFSDTTLGATMFRLNHSDCAATGIFPASVSAKALTSLLSCFIAMRKFPNLRERARTWRVRDRV